MPLEFSDLVAPVTDLGVAFPESLAAWRWLVPASAQPLLISALGDLFVSLSDSILFLDTEKGSLAPVARNRGDWKGAMQEPDKLAAWFRPGLVAELRGSGLSLRSGEVFSPLVPPILGGSHTAENYTASQWRHHLHFLGQVHDQVRLLPPGTKIDRLALMAWPTRS